jgi:hypothetical protein
MLVKSGALLAVVLSCLPASYAQLHSKSIVGQPQNFAPGSVGLEPDTAAATTFIAREA